jgi:hypothetical protein
VLEIFGKGFGFHGTRSHSLSLRGDALTEQSIVDGTHPLAVGSYYIASNGIIRMSFDRNKYYPHWNIDYVIEDGQQSTDANVTYDDDGPPLNVDCTKKETTNKDGSKTSEIILSGNFFSTAYGPTSGDDSSLKFTASTLTSPLKWIIEANLGKSQVGASIQIKASKGAGTLGIPYSSCTQAKQ